MQNQSLCKLLLNTYTNLKEFKDFGAIIDKILKVLPRERRTALFSATLTAKVESLQRASLQSPLRVSVSTEYQTVSTLLQRYIFIPYRDKVCFLIRDLIPLCPAILHFAAESDKRISISFI